MHREKAFLQRLSQAKEKEAKSPNEATKRYLVVGQMHEGPFPFFLAQALFCTCRLEKAHCGWLHEASRQALILLLEVIHIFSSFIIF